MTDKTAVLFANEAFYAAFANMDVAAMSDVWSSDESITCSHPGWPSLSGRKQVMDSWHTILQNNSPLEISCQSAEVHLSGELAYVVCLEVLPQGSLLCTNIFACRQGRWRMVHHHASAAPRPATADTPSNTLQ